MRFEPGLLSKAILAATFAVVFAGCGGSGGGHDDPAPVNPEPETRVLSGTAAAGAPIIGQVTIKDATGAVRAVDIEANGHYSVDVTDLTAPFLLRAAGEVGGRRVTLLSAATSADLDGTINITPFTDLIVANIAGQVATQYFESGNFTTLNAEQLNSAKTVLTQRLQPILTAMGISESFDLLRTSFNADRSGFDAVMDVVRVTVDESTGTAQIRDLINNTQIIDNLADAADAEPILAPVIGLVGVAGDLAAIDAVFAALQAQLAVSLPNPDSPAFRSLFVADGSFLDAGDDLETFLLEVTTDDEVLGVRFSGITILERIDANTIRVGVQLSIADGSDSDSGDFVLKKIEGAWKIAGDQRSVGTDVGAVNSRDISGSFGWLETGSSYKRFLQLYVDYAPVDVEYVIVRGPGITSTQMDNAVIMRRSTQFEGFSVINADGSENGGSWISECGQQQTAAPCVNFGAVGVDSVYTFTPLDSNMAAIAGKPAFTHILPAGPLTNALAEANAARLFGSVASVLPAGYSGFTDGTTITVTLSLPPAGGSVLSQVSYNSDMTSIQSRTLNAGGNSVDLTWEGPAPTQPPSLSVWTTGDLNRDFVTNGRHNTP